MYSIMSAATEFVPADYAVFVEVAYHKNCGFKPDEKLLHRIGAARTIADAKKMIAHDQKAMGETYGGLFEPVRLKTRTYSIWKITSEKVA